MMLGMLRVQAQFSGGGRDQDLILVYLYHTQFRLVSFTSFTYDAATNSSLPCLRTPKYVEWR